MESTVISPARNAGSMKIAFDTIVAPREAFEALRERNTWTIALLLTLALGTAGFLLERPAAVHANVGTIAHMVATNRAFDAFSDVQKRAIVDSAAHPNALQTSFAFFETLVFYVVAILLNALLLLAAAVLGGGKTSFKAMWRTAANIALPTIGMTCLVSGAVAAIAGADRFSSAHDLAAIVPSLATVLPLTGFAASFFGALNVFTLWGVVLNGLALREIAGVKSAFAWIAPACVAFAGALLTAAFTGAAG